MELLVLIFEFCLLYWLQIRNLFGGDSAEYKIVGNTWSVAHPPGYPLYSFLLNLFRVAHIPSYMNILSILPTVATSYLIYRTFCLFKKNKLLALIPALLYVFLFPIWLYSEVPEVFSLNNFFIALITYLLLKSYLKRNSLPSFWVFFILGLACTNHQTFILFIPGWYFLIKNRLKLFFKEKKYLLKSFCAFVLGLSFYLYAPIASSFNPPLDVENSKTLSGLFRLVTRYTYGTFRSYMGSKPDLLNQVLGLFSSFVYILLDFRFIGIVVIALGFIFLLKTHREIAKFALTTIFFELVFLFYINFSLIVAFGAATFERFLISYYFVLVLLFGFGIFFIYDSIFSIKLKNGFYALVKNVLIYVFGVILIFIIASSNFSTIKYVKSINQFDFFAKDILDNLPKNSLLATTSDNSSFTVGYYYFVKGYRNDIKLITTGIFNRQYYQQVMKKRYPQLDYSAFKKNDLNQFIKDNSNKYQIFFETPSAAGYWAPYGLVWKYYSTKESAEKDKNNLIAVNQNIWDRLHIPLLNNDQLNIYHLKTVRDDYLGKELAFARYLFAYGDPKLAEKYLKQILAVDPQRRDAQGILINVDAKIGECQKAKTNFLRFNQNLNISDADELTRALSYYYYCDKKNPEMNFIFKEYQKITR
ncbi:DUF2723 domain-containing protein [Patescibacteria group bacterium]|nr:DUF2723 domain-containing protein [Patescibacteria group bacterium]